MLISLLALLRYYYYLPNIVWQQLSERVLETDNMNLRLFPTAFISRTSNGDLDVLPCRHGLQTPKTLIYQCHQRHNALLLRLAHDPFYGLTDDGDFAILGVNVEEATDDDAINEAGQVIGSDLSSLMPETSFSGLSDDTLKTTVSQPGRDSMDALSLSVGASADFGIVEGAISLNDALFGRLPTNDDMGISAARGAKMSDILGQLEETMVDGGIQGAKGPINTKSNNNIIDEESLTDIKEWLLTIIPKLNDYDMDEYAKGLSNIGFHPECVTMCELKYEDLDFMKVLHRRYLFNEVTGIEHPWEA